MNQINLMGHIGKDAKFNPERETVEFSIATKESWKDSNGDWQSSTDWHFCKSHLKSTKDLVDRLRKGTRVLVMGKQKNSSVKNEETGEYRNYNHVEVRKITVIDSMKEQVGFTTEDIPF